MRLRIKYSKNWVKWPLSNRPQIGSQDQLLLLFVWLDSLRPINNLSVIKGRVSLGWTSTRLELMFLLKDTTQWRWWGSNPPPLSLESSTLPLSHCAPQLLLNAGQKYCRMLQGEHSAILLNFIKLPFVIKIFVLSIFEWLFYTGFIVINFNLFIITLSTFL